MSTQYPKGAEWRKWDLHLHTPETAKNDQFGGSSSWESYIEKIEGSEDIAVLGITDYFSIDNYTKVKQLQTEGRIANKFIIPNVELRILPVTTTNTPINLHVLFDPEIENDTIEREFFRKLKFSYQGSEYSCIKSDLITLGRAYKADENLPEKNAWEEGIGQFNISFTDLKNILSGNILSGHYLIGVSNSSTDGNSGIQHSSLAATRQEIYRLSDFIFSGNPNDTTYFLGMGVDDPDKVEKQYGSLKPCFTGSDAHSLEQVCVFNSDRFTWIKADPTFEGLKQVINEPETRVYIGQKPPILERISNHRTKYIKGLSITQADGYDENEGVWFRDVTIPFNSELVAIIGNKGSGKSAIADVLSLCSNYHDDKDFSFLTSKKFREKHGKIAKNFDAKLIWESGVHDEKNLYDSPADTEILEVKYLPQGQFERLTNEISTVKEFQDEIESVVFSHISETERLGVQTFSELIGKKTSAVEAQLVSFKNNIKEINKDIIELERKATSDYETEINNKLKKKKEELDALEKPIPVADPNEDPVKKKQNEAINEKIDGLKNEIKTFEDDIKTAEDEKKGTIDALQKLKNIKEEVQQKETELSQYISDKTDELSELDINIENLISIKTDYTELDEFISTKEGELKQAQVKLGEIEADDDAKSLTEQLDDKKSLLKVETDKLDADQKLYQQYLTAQENWLKERNLIIGDSETFDTLEFYQNEIVYLGNALNVDLETEYEKRRLIVRDIFNKKHEVINIYKAAGERLNSIIDDNSEILKNYKITVDASLVKKTDFNTIFLSFILQNKTGTFHSKDGAERHLIKLLSEIDFDNKEDIIFLLNNIIESLRNDKRDGKDNKERNVNEQVKDIPALYNYLFSLDFLDNNYQLKQGNKGIEQLSPGERGALLLVFYLLLDKNDIPLIIDQPEDNLDNHSVAKILVPFIKAAKTKRQIIMVTHNPNLAVVADAEQVIYVNLDKEKNYTFSTVSGSIEDKEVNSKIVEVLEGAMPAFNTRKRKYYDQ